VKFTSAGAIRVEVSAGPGVQRIAVTDSGPGIPEADHERVFEAFEQRDPIQSKHVPGIGLGLSLVRELGAALGARVELRSAVGVGSTFTVVIPSSPADQPGFAVGTPVATA
jgi:signal transduction histidine kinase